jgi:hypothetical protein
MAELATIPAYLLRNGTDGGYANAPAIREKDLGIWRTYTWSDYLDNVGIFLSDWRALVSARMTSSR